MSKEHTPEELLRIIGGGVISKSVAINAMENYASQQTYTLKAELEAAKKEVAELIEKNSYLAGKSLDQLTQNAGDLITALNDRDKAMRELWERACRAQRDICRNTRPPSMPPLAEYKP